MLANARFLRHLAARLRVRPQDVDDVLQQTWLSTLRERDGFGKPRSWLASVLRHRWLDMLRSEEAQRHHEGRASEQAVAPSEVLSEDEERLREVLARALTELREPYRTTILLHYYEGLTTPAVARRTGVSEETARTRVRRGLALLRERLIGSDGRRGARRSLFFLPFLRRRERSTGSPARLHPAWIATGATGVLVSAALLWSIAAPAGGLATAVVGPRNGGVHAGTAEVPALRLTSDADRRARSVSPTAAPSARPLDVTVYGEGGRPAEGARVVLYQGWQPGHQADSYERPLKEERTDENGHARFERVPRTYNVRAQAERLVSRETYLGRSADDQPERVELHLVEPRTIRGRVVDEDGDPIAGALVSTSSDPNALDMQRLGAEMRSVPGSGVSLLRQTIRAVTTDATGRFELSGLAPARYALVTTHDEFSRATALVLEHEHDVTLRLVRRGALELRVVTHDGHPAVDSTVTLLRGTAQPSFAGNPPSVRRADERGVVELPALNAGEWAYAHVAAPHHAPALLGPIELRPERVSIDVELRPRRLVAVRVVDEHGAPLATASVRPRASWVRVPLDWRTSGIWQLVERATDFPARPTDADGRVLFDDLPAIPLELVVSRPGSGPEIVYGTVTTDQAEVVVPFVPPAAGVSIAGTVRDGTTREAIGNAEVVALGSGASRQVATHSDERGGFHLELPRAGSWSVVVRAKGYATDVFDVTSLAGALETDVELFEARNVELELVGPDGTALADTDVFFETLDGRPAFCRDGKGSVRTYARTGDDGTTSVRGLPGTRVRLRIDPPGLALRESHELDLEPAGSRRITLRTTHAPGTVPLRIELREGSPEESRPLRAPYRATLHDAQGTLVAAWTGAPVGGAMVLEPDRESYYLTSTASGLYLWRNLQGRSDAFNRPATPVGSPVEATVLVPPVAVRLKLEAEGFAPIEQWFHPAHDAFAPETVVARRN